MYREEITACPPIPTRKRSNQGSINNDQRFGEEEEEEEEEGLYLQLETRERVQTNEEFT